MARIARIILPGKGHLVSFRIGQPGLNSSKRKAQLLEIMQACAAEYGIKVLAWCLLRDSATFVVAPPSAEALSTCMRIAQTRYRRTAAPNGQAERPDRYSCAALDGPATLEAIRYVEALATTQRGVKTPEQYDFCSAGVRSGADLPAAAMLDRDNRLTAGVDDWSNLHDEPIEPARVDYLAMRLRTGKPIGSPAFVKRIEQKLGKNLSRPRGRPRKTPQGA